MAKKLLINTLIFLSLFVCIYIGEKIGPNKVGFWCNDESIRHDFKPQVIDFRLLLFIVFVLPALTFIAIDRTDLKYHLRNYYYGLLTNILLTMYCKLIIARPRPNFYSLCEPIWEQSDVGCRIDEKLFITDYTCSNSRKWLTKNSNQSFFSGHSSLGTYSALFLIFYLKDNLKINGFLKAHIFLVLFMLGLLPGLTQYLNFWHFASDVIVGDLTGVFLAVFVYYGIRSFEVSTDIVKKSLKTNS